MTEREFIDALHRIAYAGIVFGVNGDGEKYRERADALFAELREGWDARWGMCGLVGTIMHDYNPLEPVWYEHELSCGHTVKSDSGEPPAYCGECGRKVDA